jgi:hypothetical protein
MSKDSATGYMSLANDRVFYRASKNSFACGSHLVTPMVAFFALIQFAIIHRSLSV